MHRGLRLRARGAVAQDLADRSLARRRDEPGHGVLVAAGGQLLVPGGQHAADGLVAGGADPVRLAVDVDVKNHE